MITGYGQERPIVDGNNSSYDIIQSTSTENAFVTIQRIKVQNNKRDCISLGVDPSPGRDNFSNIVDVETFNCVNFDFTAQEREGGVLGNANIALYNSNNAWLFHVASNHSMDHCIKIGDNSSNTIVEWSIAYECGWWPTFASEYGITDYRSQLSTPRAVAFDLVADSDNVGYNRILRYNIGRDALYGGIQLRNSVDSSVHHNEIYGTPRFDDLSGINCSQSDPPYCPQVLVIGYGDPMNPLDDINVYSNVIHDAGDAEASGIGTNRVMASHTISIYNNLLYGNKYEIALYGYTNSGITNRKINIFNNTLWHNNSAPAINAPYDWGTGEVTIKNNIIAQLGNGKCVNLDSDIQDYSNNLYYFPNGTRGNAQSVNDYANGASTNPLLSLEPIGSFAFPMGAPAQNSGAINNAIATELFNNSFNGTTRPQGSNWDIGAYEFIEVQSDLICNMHMERYSTEQLNQERLKWISGEITLKEFIIKIKIWKYCPTT
jgi:hypothetical protein